MSNSRKGYSFSGVGFAEICGAAGVPVLRAAAMGSLLVAAHAYAADLAPPDVPPPPPSQPNPEPTLRVGGYFGVLTSQALLTTVFEPWRTHALSSYLADVHAIYTFYRLQSLPLDFELEGGIAKRFGDREGGQQFEFDLIPMARWKYFPWNNYVYTNIRLGLIGASYTTGISDFERHFDSSGHSARFLNFLVPELVLAPKANSPFEVFVRVHHRSGIYGLIDHVHGASNYVAGGIRFPLH